MSLDDLVRFSELDPDDMLGYIGEFPQTCRAAWELTRDLELPSPYRSVRHVTILGMGGSAIGGALLRGLAEATCAAPIAVVRGYSLPAFVQGSGCLVIACSYSGNTEETLAAFGEAMERDVLPVVITTGGKLSAMSQKEGIPWVRFDYPSQPRAAMGYSFVLLLGLLGRLGLLQDYGADLEEAIQVVDAWQAEIRPEVPAARNAAKSLAEQLHNRLPVVYGAGFLAPVANRWKTQINENSKQWAFHEELPELDHNAVVGLGIPEDVRDAAVVVMLRSSLESARMQARWDATQELLQCEGVESRVVRGRGDSRLAHMLSLVHFGDYVSGYLVNGVDPTPVEAISFLKRRLAEVE
jgi:glucose/mannose-6-phosphate isomerase